MKLLCYSFIAVLAVFGPSLTLFAKELKLEELKKLPEVGAGYRLPIQKTKLEFTKENGRIFYIPLKLEGRRDIKITIWHGFDNTGDRGLRWRLVDATNIKEFDNGFTDVRDDKTWIIRGISTLKPILIIEDKDSKFTGKSPGNGFWVQVTRVN